LIVANLYPTSWNFITGEMIRRLVASLLAEQKGHIRHIMPDINRTHTALDFAAIRVLLVDERDEAILHLSTILAAGDGLGRGLRSLVSMARLLALETIFWGWFVLDAMIWLLL
jgi:hypothetical protein